MNSTSPGSTLLVLAVHFAALSLFAIGGANAAIPEMHRVAVELQHWMTDAQFAEMYALAQITPGPNVIVTTLIGYHVAGLPGALTATAAMVGPTCVFAFWISRIWDRFKNAPWRAAVQSGLVPVSLGLLAASALLIARGAGGTWVSLAIMAATAVMAYFSRISPLWAFAVAGLIGMAVF
jgi:chromate transporter